MTTWREIDRIRKNVGAFQALAKSLLGLTDITEWEASFLESVSSLRGVDEFTTRQAEKLLQIRDDTESVDVVRGFKVKALVEACYLARLDLSEDDEQWIIGIYQKGSSAIKRRQAGHLLRCAAQLGLIEDLVPA